MLKHFGEDTFGRETITASLQCMTDCAHNINELKRSHEHAMKIQEIQSMLYNFEGYHLMDFGKLVYEVSVAFDVIGRLGSICAFIKVVSIKR